MSISFHHIYIIDDVFNLFCIECHVFALVVIAPSDQITINPPSYTYYYDLLFLIYLLYSYYGFIDC